MLVIQPDPGCPLDEYAAVFERCGLGIRTVLCGSEPVPQEIVEDALVVLGGEMGVRDEPTHRWLDDVRRLQRTAVDRGIPSLGICLGAQLLATAFGGEVGLGDDGFEVGVVDVEWRSPVVADALANDLPNPFPAVESHFDAITKLPPGSAWLASSDRYPHQMFRVGQRAWGIQFHPEVLSARFDRWMADYSGRMSDRDRDRMKVGAEQVRTRNAEIKAATDQLAMNFAQIVLGNAGVKA